MVNWNSIIFSHVNLLLAQASLQGLTHLETKHYRQISFYRTFLLTRGFSVCPSWEREHWGLYIGSQIFSLQNDLPPCPNSLARISHSPIHLQKGLRNIVFCLSRKGQKTKVCTISIYCSLWKMFLQASCSWTLGCLGHMRKGLWWRVHRQRGEKFLPLEDTHQLLYL